MSQPYDEKLENAPESEDALEAAVDPSEEAGATPLAESPAEVPEELIEAAIPEE